jgi:hypothetical protein
LLKFIRNRGVWLHVFHWRKLKIKYSLITQLPFPEVNRKQTSQNLYRVWSHGWVRSFAASNHRFSSTWF